jgi:hypothetical protein
MTDILVDGLLVAGQTMALAHDTGASGTDLVTSDSSLRGTADPGSSVSMYASPGSVGDGDGGCKWHLEFRSYLGRGCPKSLCDSHRYSR